MSQLSAETIRRALVKPFSKLLPRILIITAIGATTLVFSSRSSHAAETAKPAQGQAVIQPVAPAKTTPAETKTAAAETDEIEPKIIEGPNGTLLTMPIIPKARDRIGEKNTIVLIAGKPVKILCAGKVDYAIFGNDTVLKDLSKDKDSDFKPCDEVPGQKCGIVCEPSVDHGFTNLMLKDARTVYHRDLEIRGPKSKDYAKALKFYKPEITLSDE